LNEEGKVILKNLRLNEMHEFMEMIGEGSGRSIQIWKWLYSKGRWIENLEQASGGVIFLYTINRMACQKDTCPLFVPYRRQKLEEVATVDSGLKFDSVVQAGDGTRKMIFEVTAGNAKTKSVETVIIPMKGGKIKSDRYTICVSSQVGCAMNCQFCYTGRLGLLGNLMTSQIVEQVVQAKRYLKSINDETPVSHIVFMGMGEPFDNYRAVMGAVAILSEPSHGGLQFDARKITVSTVGLVDRIRQFRQESKAQLAVSLHAPTDEAGPHPSPALPCPIRDRIVPLNKRHDLKELLGTLRELYPEVNNTYTYTCILAVEMERLKERALKKKSLESWNSRERQCIALPWQRGRHSGRWSLLYCTASTNRRREPSAHHQKQEEDTSRPDGRRARDFVVFEYTMLGGVNDREADARRLLEVTRGINCIFNLITFNTHQESVFQSTPREQTRRFRQILLEGGRICTIRDSRGDDNMSACGQLG
ncbi:unnamed protein product, partial [Heterosigma akashiwo]